MNKKKPEVWAVVPAAGIGTRMESEKPKQYLQINGQSILEISINKLLSVEAIEGVVVAVGKNDSFWQQLSLAKSPRVHTVIGGQSRSESVMSALHYLSHLDAYTDENIDLWACVHDAARPCVCVDKIDALVNYCIGKNRGAILGMPLADTIKRTDEGKNHHNELRIERTENREHLWQAHTPQMFLVRELKPALDYCELDSLVVTDEASAIENVDGETDLVLDRRDNIKVTLPEDLALAEFILQQQRKQQEST